MSLHVRVLAMNGKREEREKERQNKKPRKSLAEALMQPPARQAKSLATSLAEIPSAHATRITTRSQELNG